ncbi:hypothetical protein SELMODRAFT_426672 [Selaginella moellendorffii]|uniref:Uncharacterized protein n=2 Tax=Selaginella moellendorffii TaxID=88036 RepID=D8SX48_SELML|nr:hypothetical protein SELMODRAFT_426672 [Selaginella moellendorffii]
MELTYSFDTFGTTSKLARELMCRTTSTSKLLRKSGTRSPLICIMTYKKFLEDNSSELSTQINHVQGWFLALYYLLSQPQGSPGRGEVMKRVLYMRDLCANLDPSTVYYFSNPDFLPSGEKIAQAMANVNKPVGALERVRVSKEEIKETLSCDVPKDLEY